jgi:hypothetical protein
MNPLKTDSFIPKEAIHYIEIKNGFYCNSCPKAFTSLETANKHKQLNKYEDEGPHEFTPSKVQTIFKSNRYRLFPVKPVEGAEVNGFSGYSVEYQDFLSKEQPLEFQHFMENTQSIYDGILGWKSIIGDLELSLIVAMCSMESVPNESTELSEACSKVEYVMISYLSNVNDFLQKESSYALKNAMIGYERY